MIKSKGDLAREFVESLDAMRPEDFRAMLRSGAGEDLMLFINEYAERIAAKWAPGLAQEATTLLVLGYLMRAHEEQWFSGGTPRPSA